MTTTYDVKVRLEVVEALVDNPDLDAAAEATGLGRSEVLDIASKHGFPVFDRMMKARDMLANLVKAANTPPAPRRPLADFGDDFTTEVLKQQPAAQLGYAPAPATSERFEQPETVAPAVAPAVVRGASSAAQQELVDVPLEELLEDEDNPRDDINADLDDLVASITQAGLLQPIVAQRLADGRLKIVAGHRRKAALRRLGWPMAPTVVREEMGRAEVLAAMLIENSQRRDLDPIQEARACQHLMTIHHLTSHHQVAAKIGKNQVWVSQRLSLLSLSPEDQRKLRAGDMTLGEAITRGRAESGRARGPRSDSAGRHLTNTHGLARFARQLCEQSGHPRGLRVGAVACGQCWEQVIRGDERRKIVAVSAETGTCACCDREMP